MHLGITPAEWHQFIEIGKRTLVAVKVPAGAARELLDILRSFEAQCVLPPGTRAKDISCRVMPTSLRVAVLKEDERRMLVQGALLRKVRSDDSSWTIEASPSNDALRVLRLVLPKVVPTKGSQHWTSLLGEKVT